MRAPPTGKKRHWAHQAWAEEDPSWEYHEQEHADQVEQDEQWDEWEEAYEAEEQPSDEGASQHEEVDQAYATYKERRKKLKEIHKSQGFFKGELTFEERKKAVQTEKQRTRCAACGQIGHWAGDAACSKGGARVGLRKSEPSHRHRRPGAGKKGAGKGRGGKSKARAYLVGDQPLFFNLGDDEIEGDAEDVYAFMVGPGDQEEDLMVQDMGKNEYDDRRKQRSEASDSDTWTTRISEAVESSLVNDEHKSYATAEAPKPWISDVEKNALEIREKVQITLDIPTEKLTVLSVENVKDILPDKPISEMKVIELQHECLQWGLHTSGLKAQLADRLTDFFAGKPVPKKGHSTKFVQLGTRVTTTCTTSAASSDCSGKPKSFPPEMRANRKGALREGWTTWSRRSSSPSFRSRHRSLFPRRQR